MDDIPTAAQTAHERKRLARIEQFERSARAHDILAQCMSRVSPSTGLGVVRALDALIQELCTAYPDLGHSEDVAVELLRAAIDVYMPQEERVRTLSKAARARVENHRRESLLALEQSKRAREGRRRKAQEELAKEGIVDPDAEARESVPGDKRRQSRPERPLVTVLDSGSVSSKRQRIEAPRARLSPEAAGGENVHEHSSDSE